MPRPKKGESLRDYLKYCPSVVVNEGTTSDYKQAYAICVSMYKQHKKKERKAKAEHLIDGITKEILKNESSKTRKTP